MKFLGYAIVCCTSVFWLVSTTVANPARFWISTSGAAPIGPEAPTILGVNGSTQIVYIWAQPATIGTGPYSIGNPFKDLVNFSLNLVPQQPAGNPIVDFQNNSISVFNPIETATVKRFQYVADANSTSPLAKVTSDATASQVLAGSADQIHGLQGFTITSGQGAGFGPTCSALCTMTLANEPAWLIGSMAFQTLKPSGTIVYSLQIGSNGMNHAGEDSSATSVVFGTGSLPGYNAKTNRNVGAGADLTVTAVPSPPGDYNHDGIVNAADYTVWRDTLGSTTNLAADGNSSGSVDSGDYTVWKTNFGTRTIGSGSSASASAVVPEPASVWMLLAGSFSICTFATRRCCELMGLVEKHQSSPEASFTKPGKNAKCQPVNWTFSTGPMSP